MKMESLFCSDKVVNTRVKVIGPRDRYVGAYINTTSHASDWQRGLSPFYLGPVSLYDGFTSKNVENGWQFSKVYSAFADLNGNPTKKYFEWAKAGWSKSFAERYPMGKGKVPLYSYWGGNKFSYIEAKKNIYIPLYAKSVVKTEAYRRLKNEFLNSEVLVLWDFDGYDYQSLGMTLDEVLTDPKRKMGHAFVLAMLLTGKIIVHGNEVVIN